MKKYLLLLLLLISQIYTSEIPKSKKYFLIPINLTEAFNDFKFGVEDEYEFTIDFDYNSINDYKNTHTPNIEYASNNYFTWSDSLQEWIETEEIIMNTINNHRYSWKPIFDYYYDINCGIKKIISVKNYKSFKRSLYLSTGFNLIIDKSKDIRNYFSYGYFDYIDPPNDPPVDGDVFGNFWINNNLITKTLKDINEKSTFELLFGLGYKFDTKSQLFNIPNLTTSINIDLFNLKLVFYNSFNMDSQIYNSNYYESINQDKPQNIVFENKLNTKSTIISGPAINVYFKYTL